MAEPSRKTRTARRLGTEKAWRPGDSPPELYKLLVENVRDYAIFALDAGGYVLSWNAGAERFKGYRANEIIGQHFSKFYQAEDIAANKPGYELEVAARDGRFEDEGWRVRKDGTLFWANVVITALHAPDGTLAGYAKVTRDLTHRVAAEEQARRLAAETAAHAAAEIKNRELEVVAGKLRQQTVELEARTRQTQELMRELQLSHEQLQVTLRAAEESREAADRARADAEDANRAKTEFLAVMSHELRTPLNAIAGYADLLRMGLRGAITTGQDDFLARIQQSERHLLSLINDVLNFAKLEAGHVEFDMADVRIQDVLDDMEALIMPLVAKRGLTFKSVAADTDLRVRADAEKLRQVLLNLLSNAIKFTPAGGLVELAVATDVSAQRDRVKITVRDTGVGIPAEKLESIFEPFVQLGRGLTDRQSGTGLGLSISRDLARGMAGDLIATSAPGEGATFTLWLRRV